MKKGAIFRIERAGTKINALKERRSISFNSEEIIEQGSCTSRRSAKDWRLRL